MRIFFDVVTLEPDKLVEAEFTQRLSLAGILPAYPSKILQRKLVTTFFFWTFELTGLG